MKGNNASRIKQKNTVVDLPMFVAIIVASWGSVQFAVFHLSYPSFQAERHYFFIFVLLIRSNYKEVYWLSSMNH